MGGSQVVKTSLITNQVAKKSNPGRKKTFQSTNLLIFSPWHIASEENKTTEVDEIAINNDSNTSSSSKRREEITTLIEIELNHRRADAMNKKYACVPTSQK